MGGFAGPEQVLFVNEVAAQPFVSLKTVKPTRHCLLYTTCIAFPGSSSFAPKVAEHISLLLHLNYCRLTQQCMQPLANVTSASIVTIM